MLPTCVASAVHSNNFIEKMVFVLVLELLIYNHKLIIIIQLLYIVNVMGI